MQPFPKTLVTPMVLILDRSSHCAGSQAALAPTLRRTLHLRRAKHVQEPAQRRLLHSAGAVVQHLQESHRERSPKGPLEVLQRTPQRLLVKVP